MNSPTGHADTAETSAARTALTKLAVQYARNALVVGDRLLEVAAAAGRAEHGTAPGEPGDHMAGHDTAPEETGDDPAEYDHAPGGTA